MDAASQSSKCKGSSTTNIRYETLTNIDLHSADGTNSSRRLLLMIQEDMMIMVMMHDDIPKING